MIAIVPVAHMQAANDALEAAGFGPGNFSVQCFGTTGVTHAALHCWPNEAFETVLRALPNVIVQDGGPDEVATLVEASGARWGDRVPSLPDTGTVAAGSMYERDGTLWVVIQTFNRGVFNAPPQAYPALLREVRRPGEVKLWRRPLDQFDSYRLANQFTGRPDECLHGGRRWRTTIDFNVHAPGTPNSGWVEVDVPLQKGNK